MKDIEVEYPTLSTCSCPPGYHDIHGSLCQDDLRRAFVAGAAWWEFNRTGFTIWPEDRNLAEKEAERRYPGGRPRRESLPPLQGQEGENQP